MNHLSPIAIFAYDRPHELQCSLAALADNDGAAESELTIFCDGARNSSDLERVKSVRAVAKSAQGFGAVRVVARQKNIGSAESIRRGVSDVLADNASVIVLEDDLITSQFFLDYMNEALRYYVNHDRVVSICGFSIPNSNAQTDTYFLPGAHCWGWGTWRRSWNSGGMDASALLEIILQRGLIYEFDSDGTEPCTHLLQQMVSDNRASWVLPWMASAIIKNQMTLFPRHSLVQNKGINVSGMSAQQLQLLASPFEKYSPKVGSAPLEVDRAAWSKTRSTVIRWRSAGSRRRILYSRLLELLPTGIRRSSYNFITRRSLKRYANCL